MTIKLLLLVFAVYCLIVIGSPSRVSKCVQNYMFEINSLGLDPNYLDALTKLKLGKGLKSTVKSKVIVDLGLGSIGYSQVFHHMLQLNISGIDQLGKSSKNCWYGRLREERLTDFIDNLYAKNDTYVYVSGNNPTLPTSRATIFNLLNGYPEAILLMNDVTDKEYFDNQHLPACSNANYIDYNVTKLPDYCYIPLLSLGGFYDRNKVSPETLKSMLLSEISFERLKPILAAYRTLIRCLVPPEQLYEFNLNSIDSTNYWGNLLHTLGHTLPSAQLNNIIAGGVKAPISAYERCTALPCYNFNSGPRGVNPSVCDDPSHHLDGATAKRMSTCAEAYASDMSTVFGEKYRLLMHNRLLAAPNMVRLESIDTPRIVLSIGPGTTGTSSVFTAITQLNITGRHYGSYSLNCADGVVLREEFQFDLSILKYVKEGAPVFWGDSPVPERWWHILKLYPKTKIIMTDIRPKDMAAWVKKRQKHHCYRPIRRNWDQCTVPMPFTFSVGGTQLSVELYNKSHIQRVSVDAASRSFEAYRQLVRCAVPKEQLLWIYMKEQSSASVFWNNLIDFVNDSHTGGGVDVRVREALIAGGVPHVGNKGCLIGGKPCQFVGRSNDSAIIPSVCRLAK